ncbi:MAG: ABC-F family ATP-binding cassette domain-containing protein [Candidatus Delongbacteria bacterium]|nr:ABC-F family ATP-binding cassette domain-containing protein [Candidatus Delongbacteria bacterium]MBN2833369.1 ABC-F family ATP-binding cassette domain-containing protein [Candidatus Delongbacteria bacterium]
MSEISLYKICKEFGARIIHRDISLDISRTDRIGFIGKNGSGKTTLFKIITGEELPDNGDVIIRKGARIGCLDQISSFPDHYTVMDILRIPFEECLNLKSEMDRLSKELENESDDFEITLKRYGEIEHKFANLSGYEMDEKIKQVCLGLKIDSSKNDQYFFSLSGGEQTIVLLAKILLENPDILLLDEPTNHLDISAVEWLEDYLKNYHGGIVVISHDRYFLDRVTNKTVELENCGINVTNGSYSVHVEEKEKLKLFTQRQYDQQQREITELEESIKKTLAVGKKQGNPGLLKKAHVMEAKLDRIIRLPKPTESRKIRLNFTEKSKTGTIIARGKSLSKSFGDKTLFDNSDFLIRKYEKIGIIGKNGAGKSTLIKMLLGEVTPDSGVISMGEGACVGYLEQEVSFETDNLSILDYIMNYKGQTEYEARSLLAAFLFFKDDVTKFIYSLSGGERTRLKLATLVLDNINTLVLDEPTNHLDIESREILEDAVRNFKGTLIFISHDRYFINRMAKKIISIDDGKISEFEGNYQMFKEFLNGKIEASVPVSKDRKTEWQDQKRQNSDNAKAKRQTAVLEEKINELEKTISNLNDEIERNKVDYEKVNNLFYKRVSLENERDKLLEEWCEQSSISA